MDARIALRRAALAVALSATLSAAQAATGEFAFTGIVTTDRLGDWEGRSVSGSWSFDTDVPGVQILSNPYGAVWGGQAELGWLNYRLVNPDGSVKTTSVSPATWREFGLFTERTDFEGEPPSDSFNLYSYFEDPGQRPASFLDLSMNLQGPVGTLTSRDLDKLGFNPAMATRNITYVYDEIQALPGRSEDTTVLDYDFSITEMHRVTAVPEPETWATLGGGLALLGWLGRRRARRTAPAS